MYLKAALGSVSQSCIIYKAKVICICTKAPHLRLCILYFSEHKMHLTPGVLIPHDYSAGVAWFLACFHPTAIHKIE